MQASLHAGEASRDNLELWIWGKTAQKKVAFMSICMCSQTSMCAWSYVLQNLYVYLYVFLNLYVCFYVRPNMYVRFCVLPNAYVPSYVRLSARTLYDITCNSTTICEITEIIIHGFR